MSRRVNDQSETGGLHNPTGNAKHGDFAFFPGSGPVGRSCTSCAHFNTTMFKNKTTVRGKCEKAAEIRGWELKALSAIYGSTSGCKYFVEKAEK